MKIKETHKCRKCQNEGINPTKGLQSNGKLMFIRNAENIYMPKENINSQLKSDWLKILNSQYPNIKFEISSIDNFIK